MLVAYLRIKGFSRRSLRASASTLRLNDITMTANATGMTLFSVCAFGGAPNNCPAGPANVYSFIQANQAAANSLAQQSGVNADYLLGLSGW